MHYVRKVERVTVPVQLNIHNDVITVYCRHCSCDDMGCTASIHPRTSSDEDERTKEQPGGGGGGVEELGMTKVSDADLLHAQRLHSGDVSHNLQNRWIRSHFYTPGGASNISSERSNQFLEQLSSESLIHDDDDDMFKRDETAVTARQHRNNDRIPGPLAQVGT